jgi:hypothetical protein
MAFLTRHIVTTEQMSEVWEVLCPGEFFQQTAQINHMVCAGDGSERRVVRAQKRQPTEDVRIAAQLPERVNLRMLSAEISEE